MGDVPISSISFMLQTFPFRDEDIDMAHDFFSIACLQHSYCDILQV